MNPLKTLWEDFNQAVWLDFIQRSLVQDGGLAKLVEKDGIRGVTSNPSIFENAIAGSDDLLAACAAVVICRVDPTGQHARIDDHATCQGIDIGGVGDICLDLVTNLVQCHRQANGYTNASSAAEAARNRRRAGIGLDGGRVARDQADAVGGDAAGTVDKCFDEGPDPVFG